MIVNYEDTITKNNKKIIDKNISNRASLAIEKRDEVIDERSITPFE